MEPIFNEKHIYFNFDIEASVLKNIKAFMCNNGEKVHCVLNI